MLAKSVKNLLGSKTLRLNCLRSKELHLLSCLRNSNEQPTQDQAHTEQKSEKPEADLKALEEKLSNSESQVLDFKDKYLRAMAETENVRVRMRKQVDDAKIFGIQGFCKDLLEIADVLNLAITNTDPNKEGSQTSNQNTNLDVKKQLNSMHQGLMMTESRLLKIFEKHGLVQIKPKEGDKFDPNVHEAIFRVPIPNKQSGSIEVVSKTGFKLHERVIRAATVGVVQ